MIKKTLIHFRFVALTLVYALVILAGVMFCAPKYAKFKNLKNHLATLERENEACSRKIHDTRRKYDRIQNDPDVLDQEVREILGEVGPYVLVVNFPEPKPR